MRAVKFLLKAKVLKYFHNFAVRRNFAYAVNFTIHRITSLTHRVNLVSVNRPLRTLGYLRELFLVKFLRKKKVKLCLHTVKLRYARSEVFAKSKSIEIFPQLRRQAKLHLRSKLHYP